jgi:hypothetical protein
VCPSPDTQSVYPNWRPKCNPDPTALTSLADREPLDENRHRTCAFAVLWPFKAAGFWRRARFPSGARDKPYPSKSARINSRFRHTGIWLICIAGERFLKPPCRPSMPSGRLIPVIIPSKRERLARERFATDCVAHHSVLGFPLALVRATARANSLAITGICVPHDLWPAIRDVSGSQDSQKSGPVLRRPERLAPVACRGIKGRGSASGEPKEGALA